MEEDVGSKLSRKIKENPLVYIGIVGCFGTAGYGLYNFKKRTISASLFLTRLRVVAQGVFVTALTLGVGSQLYSKHIKPSFTHEEKVSISNVESSK